MIIFLKSDGTVAYQSYDNINLGSNKANKLTVIAPFHSGAVMTAVFTLPNGKTEGPHLLSNEGKMNDALKQFTYDGQGLSIWGYELDSTITSVSGTLKIQLYINADGATYTSTLIVSDVNVGVRNIEKPESPDKDIYEQILSYLTDINTYIEAQANAAATFAKEARAWANGTYKDEEGNSQPVAEGTDQYQSNAKYYAEQAAGLATAAATSTKEAQAWADGTYVDEEGNSQPVAESTPQYQKNAKYYAEEIAPQKAEEAANDVLSTFNTRLSENESNIAAADVRLNKAEGMLEKAEDRLDNVDYILEQFGAVKAQVDSSAALVKSIPARSDLYAYLNSVGGKTEKYNQLLNLPEGAVTGYYFWQLAEGSSFGQQLNEKITTIIEGVTIVNNGDGTFTINGTAEKYGSFALFSIYLFPSEDYAKKFAFSIPVPNIDPYLSFGGASLPAGARVYVGTDWGGDEGGCGGDISATGGALSINQGWHICVMDLNFEAGTVFNNLTIKPMLSLGTSALPWQSPAKPYAGLRSGKVTALKVYGANKLKLASKTVTSKGITAVVDGENGTITLNGTATADASLVIIQTTASFTLEQGKSYTMSGIPNGVGSDRWWLSIQDITYKQTIDISSTTPRTFTANYSKYYLYITVKSGYTADNIVITPTLHEGETVKEPTTYKIPSAVQDLDLYGHGVTDSSTKITYTNTVDFENKQYKKYLPEKLVFDGVKVKATKADKTGVYRVLFTLPNATPSARALNITHFVVNYANTAGNAYIVSGNTTSSLVMCPYDQSLNTLDKFNAWLEEMYNAGTPVECVYAAATPEITDISADLEGFDPVIPVEGGGQIEFVNDYNHDVPSTITYNIIQEA